MTTHRWMTHVQMQERAVPSKGSIAALRIDPLSQTAHGILIIALLFGSVGFGAAATSDYGAGHVRTHHYSGQIRHKTRTDLMGTGHIIDSPWMY